MYTIQQALEIGKLLEPLFAEKLKAHIAIGGSAVYRGESTHDLDFFVYADVNFKTCQAGETYSVDKEAARTLLLSLGFVEDEHATKYSTCAHILFFEYTLNNETIPCAFFLLKR